MVQSGSLRLCMPLIPQTENTKFECGLLTNSITSWWWCGVLLLLLPRPDPDNNDKSRPARKFIAHISPASTRTQDS